MKVMLWWCFFMSIGARGGSVPMVTVQQTQQPATLFGGTPVRSQVACQVLYNCILMCVVCEVIFTLWIVFVYNVPHLLGRKSLPLFIEVSFNGSLKRFYFSLLNW